jgi:hypothetical protein
MILQCDDRQLRAGLARRRATKVSNYQSVPIVPTIQLWGISVEACAIVAATFLGPVFAVLITRWRDQMREIRARRMYVFRELLATRRQNITADHVTALNLIEIDFYGVKPIQGAWRAYHGHLNSAPAGRPMTPAENEVFVRPFRQ